MMATCIFLLLLTEDYTTPKTCGLYPSCLSAPR
jgi:hypothetical protein